MSLFVSVICTLLLSLVSLIAENLRLDHYVQYIMVAITMLSIFIGSAFATQKAASMGLILGMTIGVVYVLLSVAIGMKLSHETISLLVLANKLAAGIAAGALGGLVGINLS